MEEMDEGKIVEALHSCPLLCTILGLQGLACLSTVSNVLLNACAVIVCRSADELLTQTFKQLASGTPQQQQQQHKQQLSAVAWLLHAVPTAATEQLKVQLLYVPVVPLQQAKALVAAGIRISYAQLLAVANSMVAGVEVWVQAQQQLGIQTDIPALANKICCGKHWVSCCFCLLST
jgi:hypothetical protein